MVKITIKKVLKDKDKSIYWLAQETDLPYPTLHKLVNNKTESVQFRILDKIMEALNLDDAGSLIKRK